MSAVVERDHPYDHARSKNRVADRADSAAQKYVVFDGTFGRRKASKTGPPLSPPDRDKSPRVRACCTTMR